MSHRTRMPVAAVLGWLLAACSMGAPPASPNAVAVSPSAAATTPSSLHLATVPQSPRSALVGEWELNKTCAMIVGALTAAKMPQLIPKAVPDLLKGSVNGALPAGYDSAHPCADALPPVAHSHTFWPNGSFNSYDENGSQVDDGAYVLVDDHTFTMGDPIPVTFHFTVEGDAIKFDVVVPSGCTTQGCLDVLVWAFSVANPGQRWTRVTTGLYVP